MSKYGETQTVLRDEKFLVDALKEMGYQVEVHPEGAPLNTYYSEQEAKVASIIVRRAQPPGAFGDEGSVRQRGGRFTLIEDKLDDHSGYGKKWLGRVQQIYRGN